MFESENRNSWIAMKYSMEMLQEMRYFVVAEGVETEQMVKDLERLNCQYLQGFYFSKPVPAGEFIKLVDHVI